MTQLAEKMVSDCEVNRRELKNARSPPGRAQKIITTAVAGIREGVAVGLAVKLDKSHILINLETSKAAGIEFDVSAW